MSLENGLLMTSIKVRINWQNMHWGASGPKRSIIEWWIGYSYVSSFMAFTEMGNENTSLWANFNSKSQFYTRSCMATAIVLSQIQVIQVRIAEGLVLRPVLDGWLSSRQGMVSASFCAKENPYLQVQMTSYLSRQGCLRRRLYNVPTV